MTLTVPEAAAAHFGHDPEEVLRNLLTKAALEDYRSGKISEGRFAEILGVSIWEAQDILDQRGVRRGYTTEMLEEDRGSSAFQNRK